jgi:hypothetical protein
VQGTGGHIATLSSSMDFRNAAHRHSHVAAEHDVRRFASVRVLGVVRIRRVFPNVSMPEALIAQSFCQRLLIHAAMLAKLPYCARTLHHDLALTFSVAQKRLRPSRDIGGRRGKSVPSSGEKIVGYCL